MGFIHTSHFDSFDNVSLCLFFLLRAPQAMMDLLARQERGLVSDIFLIIASGKAGVLCSELVTARARQVQCVWLLTQNELQLFIRSELNQEGYVLYSSCWFTSFELTMINVFLIHLKGPNSVYSSSLKWHKIIHVYNKNVAVIKMRIWQLRFNEIPATAQSCVVLLIHSSHYSLCSFSFHLRDLKDHRDPSVSPDLKDPT